MNSQFITTDKIQIAEPLYDLVNNEIIPGTGINQEGFWISLSQIIEKLSDENSQLLNQRTQIQKKIDDLTYTAAQAQAASMTQTKTGF